MSFKKGDKVYIVSVSHGQGTGWSHTSESFRTRVYAELVTLTSLGKVQGTAVTVHGNLERRIYTAHTKLVATREEVEALTASFGDRGAAAAIEREKRNCAIWVRDYVDTGRAHPLGIERNKGEIESLKTCVPLPAITIFS